VTRWTHRTPTITKEGYRDALSQKTGARFPHDRHYMAGWRDGKALLKREALTGRRDVGKVEDGG
jgi:hypothetical protein